MKAARERQPAMPHSWSRHYAASRCWAYAQAHQLYAWCMAPCATPDSTFCLWLDIRDIQHAELALLQWPDAHDGFHQGRSVLDWRVLFALFFYSTSWRRREMAVIRSSSLMNYGICFINKKMFTSCGPIICPIFAVLNGMNGFWARMPILGLYSIKYSSVHDTCVESSCVRLRLKVTILRHSSKIRRGPRTTRRIDFFWNKFCTGKWQEVVNPKTFYSSRRSFFCNTSML